MYLFMHIFLAFVTLIIFSDQTQLDICGCVNRLILHKAGKIHRYIKNHSHPELCIIIWCCNWYVFENAISNALIVKGIRYRQIISEQLNVSLLI